MLSTLRCRRFYAFVFAGVISLLTSKSNAAAQTDPAAPVLGSAEQFVLGGASSFGLGAVASNGAQTFLFNLSPSLGYFPLQNIYVGLGTGFYYSSDSTGSSSSVGLVPKVGYNIPLAHQIFFFPKLGLDIEWSSYTVDGSVSGLNFTSSSTSVGVQLDPQFVFMFGPQFGISAGPGVSLLWPVSANGGDLAVNYGLNAGVLITL